MPTGKYQTMRTRSCVKLANSSCRAHAGQPARSPPECPCSLPDSGREQHDPGVDAFPSSDLVDRLAAVPGRADRLTHLEVLPPRDGGRGRLAGLGRRRRPRGVRRPRDRAAVAAPGGRRRRRPRRPARRARDRHGLRQVAGLPAARAHRGPRGPRAPAASAGPPCSTSRRPRRWPRTSWPGCAPRARRPGRPPTTATAPASSATGPATTPSTS